MQIVHQPGAPLFLMIQNLFGSLALGNPERVAYWMNFGSAVSSGLTIMFLFWTITALVRKLICKPGVLTEPMQLAQIMGAGFVGAMAYTYTDTFWFSAVESEVYAMSSLCTAVVFWAILKWEARADEPGADRWLVFIAYIMGLSIGIHLLNLLTIPVLADQLYALDETDKANVLVDRNHRFLAQQLAYYANIADTHTLGQPERIGIGNSLYALQQFALTTAMRGEEKRHEEIQELFDSYRQLFFGG